LSNNRFKIKRLKHPKISTTSIIIFVLLATIVPLVNIQTVQAATLFENGFEEGDLSAWSGNYTSNGFVSVIASEANSGTYSLNATFAASGVTKYAHASKSLGSGNTAVYARHYRNVTSLPTDGKLLVLCYFAQYAYGNQDARLFIYNNASQYQLGITLNHPSTVNYYANITIELNNYYFFELYLTKSETEGTCGAYYNDEQVISLTALNTTGVYLANFGVGIGVDSDAAMVGTNFIDDVKVASTHVGMLTDYVTPYIPLVNEASPSPAAPISSVADTTVHPNGQVRPGNQSLGQKPSLFYDEDGNVVMLRGLQTGYVDSDWMDSWIENDVPVESKYADTGVTWTNASISYAKDSNTNWYTFHLFLGWNGDAESMFPSRLTVNETKLAKLVSYLHTLAENDIYFSLDGSLQYQNVSTWWMLQEINGTAPSYGGLAWNTTVQDDFVWCWNTILDAIAADGSDTWNHLLFISPWNEYFTGFVGAGANDGGTGWHANSRDPYRYNQSDYNDNGYGNASLLSWQNYLATKYNDDFDLLTSTWNLGTQDKLSTNETGFNKICMPTSINWYSGSIRSYDFTIWFQECMSELMSNIKAGVKANHSDTLFSFGGCNQNAVGVVTSPSFPSVSFWTGANESDIIDVHFYGSLTVETYLNYDSDYWIEGLSKIAAFARATNKTLILGEFGPSGSGTSGYVADNNAATYSFWGKVASMMLQDQIAGWVPYWTEYWHAFETGQVYKITVSDARQSTLLALNNKLSASENWIEHIAFDPILVYAPFGSLWDAGVADTNLAGIIDWELYSHAGYHPKYYMVSYSNETSMPDDIPSDVTVISVTAGARGLGAWTRKDMLAISTWLDADPAHKIILSYAPAMDVYRQTLRYETYFNETVFPLVSLAYGSSYVQTTNTTVTSVTVDSQAIQLNRDYHYDAKNYVQWTTGFLHNYTWLINYTDVASPYVIANNKTAWIASGTSPLLTYSGEYALSPQSFLIINKILSNWNIEPKLKVTDYNQTRMASSISVIDGEYSVFVIGNLNSSSAYDSNVTVNFERASLFTGDYVLYSYLQQTVTNVSSTELSTGLTIEVPADGIEILVLRNITKPNVLYSQGFIDYEGFNGEDYQVHIVSGENISSASYVHWNSSITPNIISNASSYATSFNQSQQLITLTTNDSNVLWIINSFVYVAVASWVSPLAQQYNSSTVAFEVSTVGSNDTNVDDHLQIQLYDEGGAVYPENFTSATGTFTGLANGTYTAAVYAEGDNGAADYETVTFTVAIPEEPAPGDTYPISATINNPENSTYATSSTPVNLTITTNGTNPVTTWNIQFANGTWLYGSNQTYTIPTTVTINENLTATFSVWAVNTQGANYTGSVIFTVAITAEPTPTPSPTSTPVHTFTAGDVESNLMGALVLWGIVPFAVGGSVIVIIVKKGTSDGKTPDPKLIGAAIVVTLVITLIVELSVVILNMIANAM
jgi:hypothetical protein